MFKRIAALSTLALTLGVTTAAMARPGVVIEEVQPRDVAAAVIKHRIDEKIPDGPRSDARLGPDVCVSKVLEHAATGLEACKADWSMGCIYTGFEMVSDALDYCDGGVRE